MNLFHKMSDEKDESWISRIRYRNDSTQIVHTTPGEFVDKLQRRQEKSGQCIFHAKISDTDNTLHIMPTHAQSVLMPAIQ